MAAQLLMLLQEFRPASPPESSSAMHYPYIDEDSPAVIAVSAGAALV